LEGRQAVLTGASAGVGRAVAHRLAQNGATIALLARDATALATVKEEVEALGGRALAIAVDVADADAVQAAADRAAAELGPLSIWVNCAMVTVFSPLMEMSAEEFRRVTDVTYLGYVHGTKAALRHMRRSNHGVIVQVGSALAYRGIPLQSAYCGAKHAVRGFTDSLRCELLHEGSAIRLVAVHLPAVNAPQFDWARTRMAHEPRPVVPVVQPEVAAKAIVGAISGSSREIWLGSSTFATIMGNIVWPSYLDAYLARNAFEAQSTEVPVGQDRPENLLSPVPALHRTRGRFDSVAGEAAMSVSGIAARLSVIAAGMTCMIAFGGVLGVSLFG